MKIKLCDKKTVSKQVIIFSFIISLAILFLSNNVYAAERNLSVKIYTPQDFSDIWLGVSTGGYKIIAEKGTDYTFEIFVKNGMNNRSLHNVFFSQKDFPFEVNSITPKVFEDIKPMEIKRAWVNVSIPENATEGDYKIKFDIESDEFPKGIFVLESELKVVRKIKTGLYLTYAAISIILLIILFYRKFKIEKEGRTKRKYE